MFTITFKVDDPQLGDVLTVLRSYVKEMQVIANEPAPAYRSARAIKPKTLIASPKRGRKAKTSAGGESQVTRAGGIIESIGSQQFTSKTYLERTEKQGINRASAYAAIRAAIDAGTISRVQAGVFQKTGSAFAESLGLQKANG